MILSTGTVLNGSLSEPVRTSKLSEAVTLEEAERSHIIRTLKQTDGVVGGRNGTAPGWACPGRH